MTIENRIYYAEIFQTTVAGFTSDPHYFQAKPGKVSPEMEILNKLALTELNARSNHPLDDSEVHLALGCMGDRYFEALTLYSQMTLRIGRETSIMLPDREIIALFDCLGLDDIVGIFWDVPVEVNGEPVNGLYTHSGKRIEIRGEQPDIRNRIISLALDGRLAPSDETLTHEKTHAIQFNLDYGIKVQELLEAQAYRTGQDTLGEFPHGHLVDFVTQSKAYPDFDSRKFNSAVWFIDRFNALRLTQREIAELINDPGSWEKSGVWRRLDKVLFALMREKGIGERELEVTVSENDLRKAIEKHNTRRIAQEVLYERFREEIDRSRRSNNWLDDRREATSFGIFPQM